MNGQNIVRFSFAGSQFEKSIQIVLFALLGGFTASELFAQNVASFQATTSRPFVTGFTPVIGPRGGVGGVAVDAAGVVQRVENAPQLRGKWVQPNDNIDPDVAKESRLRMVSLGRLNARLRSRLESGKPISEEMFFLAGLRRAEYLFISPDEQDIILAGPAGAWRRNQLGETVSVASGEATLRLDDLADSLRSGNVVRQPVSCSIEPTPEGLKRYARIKARLSGSPRSSIKAMERAMGMQQVIVTGVPKHSHFAHVMVAADYLMKRYGMGFEPAPVPELPSYMQMLQRGGQGVEVTSPRWWMAPNYEPILRSPDAMVWQLRGQAVKTLTQDTVLTDQGLQRELAQKNELAESWAQAMTDQYEGLCRERPVFGQLRNLFDLCVLSELISQHGLLNESNVALDVILNINQPLGPRYEVPSRVASQGTLVRGRAGWLASVSGGVDMDGQSAAKETRMVEKLKSVFQQKPFPSNVDRWWW